MRGKPVRAKPAAVAVPGLPWHDLAEAVEAFLNACEARGLSRSTVHNSYGHALRRVLMPFCEEEGVVSAAELDQALLDRLNIKLLRQGSVRGQLSRHSIKAYLKSINQFLTWIETQVAEAHLARAQIPRTPKKRKDILNRAECRQLEEAASTERNRILIRIMADTGARIGEVCHIRVNGLVTQGEGRERTYFLWVPEEGKTGERKVSISADLYERLQQYRKVLRPKGMRSDRLFLSEHRFRGEYRPLEFKGIYFAVKDAVFRAGLTKRVYPHLLRASAISEMCARGIHPGIIKEETGASLPVIYEFYLNPPDEARWRATQRGREE